MGGFLFSNEAPKKIFLHLLRLNVEFSTEGNDSLRYRCHFRCCKRSTHSKENSEEFGFQSHSGLLFVHEFKHDVSGLRDHGDLITSPDLWVVIFPVSGADKVPGDGGVNLGESRGAQGQSLREGGPLWWRATDSR